MTRTPLPGIDFPVPYDADGKVIWPAPNPDSPFFITGPALISFSGGRTSAFMLFQILWAHGGVLPDDVHVCFANTGKEREETLRFVHESATRWGARIDWIERRWPGRTKDHAQHFERVGFNSASRKGEPFAELLRRKQYLPNQSMRYCTTELKVRAMKHYMLSLGHLRWTNAIGLRGDEMGRVFSQIAFNQKKKQRWTTVMPMATQAAGMIRKADILRFWFGDHYSGGKADWSRLLRVAASELPQGFDLGLADHEGNCDLCFMKGRASRAAVIRDNPSSADWWIAMEKRAKCSAPGEANGRFRAEESVEQLRHAVMTSPTLPLTPEDEEFDAECGLWCAGEAA